MNRKKLKREEDNLMKEKGKKKTWHGTLWQKELQNKEIKESKKKKKKKEKKIK